MPDPGSDPTVQQLRAEIATVDRAILDEVNARIELVARIRAYKAQAGLQFVDRDRERELIDALDAANAGPLSDKGLRELYTYLLDFTKREVDRDGRPPES
jgi:chorismate mutase